MSTRLNFLQNLNLGLGGGDSPLAVLVFMYDICVLLQYHSIWNDSVLFSNNGCLHENIVTK